MSKHSSNVAAHAREAGHNHVTSRHVTNADGFGSHDSAMTHHDPSYPNPPISSMKVPGDQRDVVHEHGKNTEVESHNAPGVLGDVNKSAQTMDSPVPEHGRQMPHKEIVTKAAEVAGAIHSVGDGEGFGGGGVMGR